MLKRQKGFTLSELLVSLAVLGLIAAVSIPKVYNSVKEQREKALWKETIATLSTLFMEGAMNGYEERYLIGYVLEHVNASKVCDMNVSTQGCYAFEETTEAGFEMPNGVVINGLNHFWDGNDMFFVDINGAGGPNTVGEDRMFLRICKFDGCHGSDGSRVGEIGLFNSQSTTMYNEIFGLS